MADPIATSIGAVCFSIVIGYVTYRALARSTVAAAVSDIAAVAGPVGGGVVTGLFSPTSTLFGWYSMARPVGLLAGMLLGPLICFRLAGREKDHRDPRRRRPPTTLTTTMR